MKLSKAGATFHSGRANCASERNLSLTLTFLLLRLCVKRKQSFVLLFLEKILFSHESTSSWASMCLMRKINLKLLEKKLRRKNVTFQNVCNLITLFWQLAKLEEVSPKHSSNCAVFQRHCDVLTTDSQINHHHHHNHHIGQTYYVLRWKKKGEDNTSISEYLGLVKFQFKCFSISSPSLKNCH